MALNLLDSQEAVHLYVHGVFPDGDIQLIGRLLSESNHLRADSAKCFFQYDPSFLTSDKAYSINPASLPLSEKSYKNVSQDTDVHWVFDDSLPDGWGRKILAKRSDLELTHCGSAKLLRALGGDGLGRFIFSDYADSPNFDPHKSSIAFNDIKLALDEAESLERETDLDQSKLRHLLACGSSAGGARPKILSTYQGKFYIAKLESIYDKPPGLNINLEHAGMKLAANAGLNVPDVTKKTVGGRNVLLVKRFDCTNKGGRNALISVRSLLNSFEAYNFGYKHIAELIRKYTVSPAKDLPLFYKQMCANVFLRNGDDHLQNFSFLHTETGWGLSPVYDMVPSIYQSSQILKVNGKDEGITPDDLLESGIKEFGFSKAKAKNLLGETQESLQNWQDVFGECGVDKEHIKTVYADIDARISASLSVSSASRPRP